MNRIDHPLSGMNADRQSKAKTTRTWGIVVLLLVILTVALFALWNGNLFGKRLSNIPDSQILTFTPFAPAVEFKSTPAANFIAQPTPEPTENQGKPLEEVCGQTDVMTVLMLGIDEQAQSDVIRIVQVNFPLKKILMLSIPRDFWVPIPGLAEYNITEGRINASYGYGEYFFGPGQGIVEMSSTVIANYGIPIDRYVVFYFSDVIEAIDAVGGVDVHLDKPIGGYNYVGSYHFDGKSALEFARLREADNDDFRIDRQSLIINSLYQKLILPENLVRLPGLGIKFLTQKTIQTDFSLKDVYNAVCLANAMDENAIIFKDIPNELFRSTTSSTGGYIRIPSPEVTTYIQDLILFKNY